MIEAKYFLEYPNNIIKQEDVKKKLSFICNFKLLSNEKSSTIRALIISAESRAQ